MGWQKVFLVLLAVQAWSRTKAQGFPKMEDIFIGSYQTEVQITDLVQNSSAFATEYYDMYQGMGRLDLLVFGERKSLFYYNDTGDLLDVNSTACIASPIDETMYGYIGVFYGWLSKAPIVLGPTALLWNTKGTDPIAGETKMVRGIKCDSYTLSIDSKQDKIDFIFFFAAKDWTTAFKYNDLRVPVRILVNGFSSRGLAKNDELAEYHQIIDFAYFRSPFDDSARLYPNIGLGCFGMKAGRIKPKIPPEFKFLFESYDVVYASKHDQTSINYGQIFFSTDTQLARIDSYTSNGALSEIHDFRNGVKFSIKDFSTCKILPLRGSFFENEDYNLLGSIKTAEEVLGMTGDFAYMGSKTERGINTRVFEKTVKNVWYNNDFYYLLVVSVRFTEDFTKIVSSGESMTSAPVFIMVTGYSERNKMTFQIDYNIVAFEDVVGPSIYEDFDIQSCYPLSQQKSYFVMSIAMDEAIARKIEAINDVFLETMQGEIINKTDISVIRLPYLKADYSSAGIDVTGLLLDRPPALNQFWFVYEGQSRSSDLLKPAPDAATEEQCAYACVSDDTCKAFHFCSKTCFLNTDYITGEIINGFDLGYCRVYNRAESSSNARDQYLPQVLSILNKAVKERTLSIRLPIENNTDLISPQEIIFSEGPFEREVTDKVYNLVFNGFQHPSEDDTETTKEMSDITTLNDCYSACKQDTNIGCTSFSYCQDSYPNKQCRLSSVFMDGGKDNYGDIVNNAKCNVYSLLYLDGFDKYPGQMLMINGDKSFTQTSSPDECAMKCKTDKEIKCRGFEYCEGRRTCVLHSKHILDLPAGKTGATKDNTCGHYAAKFVADYFDMGYTLIDDSSDTRTTLTLEQCARACSEEVPTCKSFNFCPPTTQYSQDSTCSLTSQSLKDKDVKLTSKGKCHSYTKKDHVEDWGRSQKNVETTGYSKGSFTSLVIGMLAFGLIIGVAGFIVYSYYRSRKNNDGMSVRFMKQTNA